MWCDGKVAFKKRSHFFSCISVKPLCCLCLSWGNRCQSEHSLIVYWHVMNRNYDLNRSYVSKYQINVVSDLICNGMWMQQGRWISIQPNKCHKCSLWCLSFYIIPQKTAYWHQIDCFKENPVAKSGTLIDKVGKSPQAILLILIIRLCDAVIYSMNHNYELLG